MTLFVLLLCGCVAGQTPSRPDLSGRWILVEPAQPSASAPSEVTVTNTEQRGHTAMAVEWRTDADLRTESHQVGLLGGTFMAGGRQSRFSARWIDNTLRIEREVLTASNGLTQTIEEHVEVWALDAAGRLTIRITHRSAAAEPSVVRLVYRRKGAS